MVTDDIEAEARRYTADPTRVDTATALLRAYVAERDALLAEVRAARELDAALRRIQASGYDLIELVRDGDVDGALWAVGVEQPEYATVRDALLALGAER